MEDALRALLIADAPLTALVAQRIYWGAIPQSAADPNVVLYRIGGTVGLHSRGSDGLTDALVQIDVRAQSVRSMWDVRNAIVARLHGYSGIVDGISFHPILLNSERQSSEQPGTVRYHRASLDFDVWSGLAA